MKYGKHKYSIRPKGVVTRYCNKCKYHVSINRYTVPQKPITKTQRTCDYCMGVRAWEGTATQ